VADLFANGWPIFLILGGRSFCGQAPFLTKHRESEVLPLFPNSDELLLANATNSAVLRLDCFHLTSFRVD
jgi:hypothetical protein